VATLIVTDPALTPVTTPPVDTVATEALLLVQVTFLFVALEGVIVAISVSISPTKIFADSLFSETPVTGTVSVVPGVVGVTLTAGFLHATNAKRTARNAGKTQIFLIQNSFLEYATHNKG
jgi:hypothetical protein